MQNKISERRHKNETQRRKVSVNATAAANAFTQQLFGTHLHADVPSIDAKYLHSSPLIQMHESWLQHASQFLENHGENMKDVSPQHQGPSRRGFSITESERVNVRRSKQ